VILENTAGAGNTIGRSFQELSKMIELVEDKTRVGICIDTCHLFAAGNNQMTLHLSNRHCRYYRLVETT